MYDLFGFQFDEKQWMFGYMSSIQAPVFYGQ